MNLNSVENEDKSCECKFCFSKFANLADLDLHSRLHAVTGEFVCQICHEVFSDLTRLQHHDLKHSLSEAQGELDPGAIFSEQDNTLKCTTCEELFSNQDELSIHCMLESHGLDAMGDQVPSLKMEDCDETSLLLMGTQDVYPYLNELRKDFFGEDLHISPEKLGTETTLLSSQTASRESECVVNSSEDEFIENLLLFSDDEEPSHIDEPNPTSHRIVTNKPISKSEFEAYISWTKVPNTCKLCNQTYTSRSGLKRHLNTVHLGLRRFICDICDKRFTQSASLKKHSLLHNETDLYPCNFCRKRFISFKLHQQHVKNKHPGCENSLSCNVCYKQFTVKEELYNHMVEHGDLTKLECVKCEKGFIRKSDLARHRCYRADLRPFACHLCEMRFKRAPHLSTHMQIHKREDRLHSEENNDNDLKEEDSNVMILVPDRRCFARKKFTKTNSEIPNDPAMAFIHGIKAKNVSGVVVKESKGVERTALTAALHSLQKKLKMKYNVTFRKKKKTGKRSGKDLCVECYVCQAYLSNNSDLRKHFTLHHKDIPFNSCHICGKQHSKTSLVLRHLLTHQGEHKMYGCTFCHKFFSCEQYVENHISKVHNEANRLECRLCFKTFGCANSLRKHVKWHATVTNSQFKCEKCNEGFVSEHALRKHTFSYHDSRRQFRCKLCHKKFLKGFALARHMNEVHKKVRKFVCNICGGAYLSEMELERHKLGHFNVKAFKCDICGRQYTRLSHLKKHKFEKHSDCIILEEHGDDYMVKQVHQAKVEKNVATEMYVDVAVEEKLPSQNDQREFGKYIDEDEIGNSMNNENQETNIWDPEIELHIDEDVSKLSNDEALDKLNYKTSTINSDSLQKLVDNRICKENSTYNVSEKCAYK